MTPERWQRIQQLYHAALERAADERAGFLDRACAGDEELRREAESLLAAHEDGGSFLSTPALALEAREMAAERRGLAAGQRLNQFQIVSWLGAGGMGEVYLAHDGKLDRKVALKLLPAEFTQDPERLRRFAREATAASRLNHPNILTIYEIGDADGTRFIAAEFVEGVTLRQRLKNGRLESLEALEIGRQVASALDAAHKAGIVHRDIKPENLMLRPDGLVKVLDFGLARMIEPQAPAADGQTAVSTDTGAVIGTPRYMSPEQARAQTLDGRSDIFSLGVVLYEMLAGQAPFTGATTAEVFAALLDKEPKPLASAALQRILSLALAKAPENRYQNAADLQRDLQAQLAGPRQTTGRISLSAPSPASWGRWGAVAGGLLAVFFITGAVWLFLQLSSKSPPRRGPRISELLNLPNRSGSGLSNPSFSPDSKLIAYSLNDDEETHLWIKQVVGGEPKQVTEGKYRDRSPVWSPDGQELAFISDRGDSPGVWSVPYLGGTPRLLSRLESANSFLTNWSHGKGVIYFESNHNLFALDLASGQSKAITHFDPQHSRARHFRVSLDEERILYSDLIQEKYRILTIPMHGGQAKSVTQGEGGDDRSPAWFPDGQRIAYSSKQNNVYQICLAWLDGRDSEQMTFGNEDYDSLAVSADGNNLVAASAKSNANIFSYDLKTGSEVKHTSEFNLQLSPDVSRDSQTIAFQSTKSVLRSDDAISIQSRAAGKQPMLLVSPGFDPKWSPTADKLAFLRRTDQGVELWKVSASGRDEQWLTTGIQVVGLTLVPFNRLGNNYNWSPKGDRIAYFSNKSGQRNLWVVASDGSSDLMISDNTDSRLWIASPFWSLDGKHIAYLLEADGKKSVCVTETEKNGVVDVVHENNKPLRLIGWSASGKEVVVAVAEPKSSSGAPHEISLLSIATDKKQLKVIARVRGAYLHNIKLSRERDQIALVSRENGKNNIEIVPISSGRARKLTGNVDPTVYYSGLTWSPDGKTLFYSKQMNWILVSLIENFQ